MYKESKQGKEIQKKLKQVAISEKLFQGINVTSVCK